MPDAIARFSFPTASHFGAGARRLVASLSPFSTPSRPAASAAAIARYGFMSAPGQRVSMRVDLAEPGSTRKEAVRLSTPHTARLAAMV